MESNIKLSIVFGTLNRLEYLKPCLESIRASAAGIASEIIIVDGGSMDGSLEYLHEQNDVVLIEQRERLGAVRAFNAGFRAARGQYVCNFNDDAVFVGDTLAQACAYLDTHPNCGQIAIPFGDDKSIPQTAIIPNRYAKLLNKHNLLYANFGVIRRDLGETIGWWGDRLPPDKQLYQYAGDVFLSIGVWLADKTVDVLPRGNIIHYQLHDDTRVPNVESDMLDRIYLPHRAWEHERAEAKRKSKVSDARAEAQKRIVVKKQIVQPVHNPTRLRYLGAHRVLATFTDTPSGRTYRIKLRARQGFDVDSADVAWFLGKRDEHGAMFEGA